MGEPPPRRGSELCCAGRRATWKGRARRPDTTDDEAVLAVGDAAWPCVPADAVNRATAGG
ncbi:hypothetical protein GQ55_5G402500 [Panicum hallii var. hallii]|uniref:Uncharacterized protein n=1 Tax=Panicum hallii var. hallii TaxID=1504633 RepID=A0A2T7DNG4_9POAL|nr:hypothetical protein GQ55_5G402500 [Panicum hallii var. hallii]